jgi:hypothetical protein
MVQYRQLLKIKKASARGFANAPEELISRAIGLMPQRLKVRAGLLRTTLGLAGARAEADDFQVVVSVADQANRIMFVREDDGWEVIGKVPSNDWQVERNGIILETDESGRFSFKSANLNETAFEMVRGTETVEIPSAEELLLSGAA